MQRSKHFRDKEWREERKDTQVDWMDGYRKKGRKEKNKN